MRQFGQPNHMRSAYGGPTGFYWLEPGLLGGCPRPGIFRKMRHDLEALQRVHTKLLVALTEEWQPDPAEIAGYDIESLYVPIPDLCPPDMAQAEATCRRASEFIDRGEAVVFHCRAGKGRTGTLLAAMMIWRGASAQTAIQQTRHRNRQWIESDSQLAFLESFAIRQAP